MELRCNVVADVAQTVIACGNKLNGNAILGLLLLAATVLLRYPVLGDPNYHIDEGFYLLVGDRMHDGQLPYVDIWDRKPFGLFVLYWLITFFGGVHAYQIAAGLCVWLTSWITAVIVRRWHAAHVSALCGVIYIAALNALAGGGGQSPVFYNLFIAAAGLLTLNCLTENRLDYVTRRASVAMLLCGIALTFKQTSAVEGAFFGLLLVWRCWRMADVRTAITCAAWFAALGLLPTLACLAGFAAMGHADTYFTATMQTIFLTEPASIIDRTARIGWLVEMTAPLIIASTIGAAFLWLDRKIELGHRLFLTGWLVASMGGFFAVPNFYDHYAIPLVTTFAIASATLIEKKFAGPAMALLVVGWLLLLSGYPQSKRTQISIERTELATQTIRAHLGSGCLFAYDAPALLYREAHSCLPTTRIFSEHLSNAREAKAIGLDPVSETARILETRPTVIAISEKPTLKTVNFATRAQVQRALDSDYFLVKRVKLLDIIGTKPIQIWARKPDLPTAGTIKTEPDSAATIRQ